MPDVFFTCKARLLSTVLVLTMATGLWIGWSSSSQASCGIESCPAYRAVVRQNKPVHLGVATEFVDFELYGTSGQYVQVRPRIEYRGLSNFLLGFQLPVTSLMWNEETKTGLSNPIVFAEWKRRIDSAVSVVAGFQLELPFGDSELGIADAHIELLPYLGATLKMDKYFTELRIGMRQSLDELMNEEGSGEGHNHATPIFVNPHSPQEVLYRVKLGRIDLDERLVSSVYLDVVDELGLMIDRVPVMRAGVDTLFAASEHWDLRLRADRAVSENRRTETRAEASLVLRW